MSSYIDRARKTFEIEERSIRATGAKLDSIAFERACQLILQSAGRVIVTGVGKSGHIANKIASTLASTGTPAFFLHPGEAAHGDVGMVQSEDVLIVLSKSGVSDELLALYPSLRRIGVPIIAITCAPESKLALTAVESDGAVLLVHCEEEACPHDLAPTASTTAMLVLGDALAIALLEAREFSSADFARLHPAGALGRKLTFSVNDLMASGESVPRVEEAATMNQVMMEMSRKRFGATAVTNGEHVIGIITDGDLRRFFESHATIDTHAVRAKDIMTCAPRTILSGTLAINALHAMEDSAPKVMQLLVVREDGTLEGIIHMHDIVKAGIS
ncbi:MAG TPA: KpsF/GutQ family sugar-phosphate isomerase [Candidatus Kapabacteria bacterium]|nr:KpsF/GutQ family sugar-phosphate isomerase [Candidatus Kapabacteria bacterium]